MSLNYDLTLEQILDLYKGIATEEELEELAERWNDPDSSENVLARLRDSAQWNLDRGDRRYKKILETLEG